MTESRMRARVVRALRLLHAVSVENPACPGTPDVNYVEGWLELKQLHRWPAAEDTVVQVPHFTQQQRTWLLQRIERGGNAHVLLQIGNEWLLLPGLEAATILGRVPKQRLRQSALQQWHGHQELEKEIVKCLSKPAT